MRYQRGGRGCGRQKKEKWACRITHFSTQILAGAVHCIHERTRKGYDLTTRHTAQPPARAYGQAPPWRQLGPQLQPPLPPHRLAHSAPRQCAARKPRRAWRRVSVHRQARHSGFRAPFHIPSLRCVSYECCSLRAH